MSSDKQLREMVREILREVVPRKATAGASAETVRISNDAELAAFVQQVIARKDAIAAGQLRFTFAANAAAASDALDGVITEQKLVRAGTTGTLVLAPTAVLTPLARDKARQLGLKIERRP